MPRRLYERYYRHSVLPNEICNRTLEFAAGAQKICCTAKPSNQKLGESNLARIRRAPRTQEMICYQRRTGRVYPTPGRVGNGSLGDSVVNWIDESVRK
jgi:hypothetical protein